MKFIKNTLVPKHKTVTYAIFVADIRPQKDKQRIMRLTEGGNRLEYDGGNITEMSVLGTTKICVKSVISTSEARFG